MTNVINILFQLAKAQGLELCINPDDGCVYIVRERSESVARLSPIDEPDNVTICFTPERLVLADTPHKETVLQRLTIGQTTEINGSETDAERNDNGTETDAERTRNGFILEADRDTIGAGKVNLRKFSGTVSADVADVAAAIEKLLDAALSRTNKPATIEKLMKIHATAAKFAADGNIYKLNQIAARLRGIMRKQRAIRTSTETIRRRSTRRKTLIKIAVVVVTVAAVFGWGWVKLQTAPKPSTVATITTDTTATDTPSPTPLLLAFAEFEKETGKKVWPAGRRCIEDAAAAGGLIDDKEAIKRLIYNNVR